MTVYVIATYDIADPAGFEPYVPGVVPLIQKHGGEIIVMDLIRPLQNAGLNCHIVNTPESVGPPELQRLQIAYYDGGANSFANMSDPFSVESSLVCLTGA